MCRVLGYLGEPISLTHVLFDTDSSLARQLQPPSEYSMITAAIGPDGLDFETRDRDV
jgi:hypothetical protein